MRFRTEIEPLKRLGLIKSDTRIVLLGSCFSDNIGERLCRDGFDCIHNPLGPLFNPVSLCRTLEAAASGKVYGAGDFTPGPRGLHCLDYASRYSDPSAGALADMVNADVEKLRRELLDTEKPRVLILTLGSAYLYKFSGSTPVGNCHKFPADSMTRTRLTVEQCADALRRSVAAVGPDVKVIVTVSPVRHLDEGLHGNTVCKSILHLACDRLVAELPEVIYFPAYELLLDDLRDYRFYAEDMKHPSAVACDYIYSVFCRTMMDDSTIENAAECRKSALKAAHRPIL